MTVTRVDPLVGPFDGDARKIVPPPTYHNTCDVGLARTPFTLTLNLTTSDVRNGAVHAIIVEVLKRARTFPFTPNQQLSSSVGAKWLPSTVTT
eukprot:54141-Rhodomonas_salina.1